MTPDKATETRTEAAAVDRAIAEVRESLEKLRAAGRTSVVLKCWCDDANEAVNVLADAVEELRGERDRLKAAMHPHTAAFVLENVRLARQVADLEAALRRILGDSPTRTTTTDRAPKWVRDIALAALALFDRKERGCAACEGDPEAHGLHVCGAEPFDRKEQTP